MPHAETGRGWRWHVARGLEEAEQLAGPWNALAERERLTPTGDATWMSCFWSAFGEHDRDLHVHALYEGDALRAAVPLRRHGGLGSRWLPVANAHTPRWLFAFDGSRPEAAGEILRHLLDSAAGVDLGPIPPAHPAIPALRDAARAQGRLVSEEARGGDAVVELRGTWEEFRQTFRRNLRINTEKHTRALESRGALAYEVAAPSHLSRELEECFELETRGWKGERGAPVIADARTAVFYRDLAMRSAEASRFALYLLKLDGRIIAFEFGIRAHGQLDQLKCSFDPEWHSMSPGNILRFFMLRDEIAKGEVRSYHMGRPSDWKLRWASRVDPLVRLRVYRRGLWGGAQYLAGPVLRRLVKGNPALDALARRLRRKPG
jgi:CelD/BcsL family acetyltransferase involved in cellulose biosynthesis